MLSPSLCLCLALLAPALHAFLPSRARFAVLPTSFVALRVAQHELSSSAPTSTADDRTEYAAIFPGSEVRIQIGNIELARKAWKKRRRSGSPVLIPCSVLDLDRTKLVLDNLVYLIQKYGVPMADSKLMLVLEGYRAKDICMTLSDLTQHYRRHFGSTLAKQATALGFESSRDLVESLMTKERQSKLDVQLYPTTGDTLWFLTHMSRYRGHRLTDEACLLQLEAGSHTGITRRKKDNVTEYVPLSAALRVSQQTIDSGLITEGSTHKAHVCELDPFGDGGSPLLKLSMHTERKISKNKRFIEVVDARMVKTLLSDLKVGAGPFKGKVTKVSRKSRAAFVNIDVGRAVKEGQMIRVLGMLRFDDINDKKSRGNMAYALELDLNDDDAVEEEIDVIEAALNNMEYDDDYDDDEDEVETDFKDDEDKGFDVDMIDDLFAQSSELVKEDVVQTKDGDEEDMISSLLAQSKEMDEDEDEELISEEEEDITHLCSFKDGVLAFTDPETGEVTNLGSLIEDGDENVENSFFQILTPEEKLQAMGKMIDNGKGAPNSSRKFVQIGDEIDVYVQAVSKQSGRFMLTTRPVVQKMKQIKKDNQAEKKLERLIAKMGGNVETILKLSGTECDGVITATSKAGGWLYVQPRFRDLPIGVARIADDILVDSLSKGDSVRIRLEGIDKTRGQLAMTVIGKP